MQVWLWTDEVPDLVEPSTWKSQDLSGSGSDFRALELSDDTVPAPGDLVLCGGCSSALDVAWYLRRQNRLPVHASVLCRSQWSGRGQMRRNWVSPEGNVYAAWHLPATTSKWSALSSLLVGHALVTAFAGMGVRLQIKWPNDLLLEGRKVGGILVEERDDTLIAGIGLNVAHCPEREDLRRDSVIAADRLGPFFENVHIVPFWTELVSRAQNCYEQQISQESTREFIHLLEPFLAFLHQEVTVSGTSQIHRARVLGLHHDGGLRLQHDQEEIVLYSGSVQPEESR